MTTVLKSYKYRLYPKGPQVPFLANHFGAVRFIYNYFLRLRDTAYKSGTKLSGLDTKKMLPALKNAHPWLRQINSQSLQESVLNLEKAYQRFFKNLGDHPAFKKKRSRQSFTVPQHFSIKGTYLFIPKLETGLRVNFHRPISGILKSCTISREPSDTYFVSFTVEEMVDTLPGGTVIEKDESIDLGLTHFVTFSNGEKIKPPQYLRQSLKKLARLQRQFSRKQKGSNNRNKARIKIAKLHEYVKNQRSNFLHRLSSQIVNENQVIYLEDLNVKGMMQWGPLGLSIADAGLGEFVRQVKYKSEWSGKKVIQIDRWFPSSKVCSACGYIKDDLTLNDREWICPQCGTLHDRDINAAKNILNVGRDSPEVTPVEKKTAILSIKGMRNRTRREGKSSSVKQETKVSDRVGVGAL